MKKLGRCSSESSVYAEFSFLKAYRLIQEFGDLQSLQVHTGPLTHPDPTGSAFAFQPSLFAASSLRPSISQVGQMVRSAPVFHRPPVHRVDTARQHFTASLSQSPRKKPSSLWGIGLDTIRTSEGLKVQRKFSVTGPWRTAAL